MKKPIIETIRDLCGYLYDKHPLIARNPAIEKSAKIKNGEKLAEVIGRKSHKAAYNIVSQEGMSKRDYQIMCDKFKILKRNENLSEDDKTNLDSFYQLKKIIDQTNSLATKSVSRSVLEEFEDSKWYIYQRFFDNIGRKLIFFKNIVDNQIPVTIDNRHLNRYPANGFASINQGGTFLRIQTTENEKTSSLTEQYTIMLNPKALTLNLAIGHLNLSNVENNNNLVSKTVIIKRVEKDEGETHFKFPLTAPIALDDVVSKRKVTLDQAIFKFLINRQLNRLSSPHYPISTIGELEQWQERNKNDKIQEINPHSISSYEVRYKKSSDNSLITKDTLEIKFDEVFGELVAVYTHLTDKKKKQEFRGAITYSILTNALFINLQTKTLQPTNRIENAIFLILNLPRGEEEFTTLTGIISGITDNFSGAIGLLVVAQKKEAISAYGIEDNEKKINTFFKYHQNQSITFSTTTVASINDLDKI